MTPQELQQRTFEFGLRAYEFSRPLLRNIETRHIGNQLIRAATSVAANNRAAGHDRGESFVRRSVQYERNQTSRCSGWTSSGRPNLQRVSWSRIWPKRRESWLPFFQRLTEQQKGD
jgi:hypothetical protein